MTSDLIKDEILKLTKFKDLPDLEFAKKLATVVSIDVKELTAEEIIQMSDLLDEVSEMSKERSDSINHFKNEVLIAVNNILSKTSEIGAKTVVGMLLAAI